MTMPELSENKPPWSDFATQLFKEVQAWRSQHPRATFDEIEEAVDQRLARLKSQMLQDSSLTVTDQLEAKTGPSLLCEKCGVALHKRGKQKRSLLSEKGQTIRLERDYLVCPKCGVGLFPPGL